MGRPELLMPAGSLEVLKTAVIYGADAVYIGGEVYGLRAKAKNFSLEDMRAGVDFAHEHGKKVYITANILAHNDDLEGASDYFRELREIKPDALIVSDPGMFALAREICPEMDIHISTQANNTNYRTFLFWHSLGAKRVVSARELTLAEICEIRRRIPDDLEIESFVHGAMCVSYSGRCLLSNYFTGRDANRGSCTHPCRWRYAVMEETRPGEYMPVFENDRGTFLFNSRDLCMVEHIPKLLEAGVDSFKVEGRMRTALYAATVARAYRRAMDDYFESPERYRSHLSWYLKEIAKCTHRPFSTGFYFGRPQGEAQSYEDAAYRTEYTFLGSVEGRTEDGLILLHQKNKFTRGEHIEIMRPGGEDEDARVTAIFDGDGDEMESAPHPGQTLYVRLSAEAEPHDILRREEEGGETHEDVDGGCSLL